MTDQWRGINLRQITKIVSEYDQEIPQSQTADNPVAQSLSCVITFFSCLNIEPGTSWNYLNQTSFCLKKRLHMIFGWPISTWSLLSGSAGSLAIGGCPFVQAIYWGRSDVVEDYFVPLFSQLVSPLFLVELFEPLAE